MSYDWRINNLCSDLSDKKIRFSHSSFLLPYYNLYFNKKQISKDRFVTSTGDLSANEFCPIVSEDWMDKLIQEWEGVAYDKYSNIHVSFSHKLYWDFIEDNKYHKQGKSYIEFTKKLNDIQSMYLAMVTFEGQTNNGGVYQFLLNSPHDAIITWEAMDKANLPRLSKDYKIVLDQYFGKFKTIVELN